MRTWHVPARKSRPTPTSNPKVVHPAYPFAVGDFDGDGKAELAVGYPYLDAYTPKKQVNAGALLFYELSDISAKPLSSALPYTAAARQIFGDNAGVLAIMAMIVFSGERRRFQHKSDNRYYVNYFNWLHRDASGCGLGTFRHANQGQLRPQTQKSFILPIRTNNRDHGG